MDLRQTGNPGLYVPQEKIASVCQALILGTRDYLGKCGFKRAVVGLSGGVDSAVVCALAVKALGKDNVLGVAMPSMYSSPGSLSDSRKLAENLGIAFEVIPITPIYDAYRESFRGHFDVEVIDITLENIQARIRRNILMALSNKFGHLVLSTGNKSEIAVGYCTLYGDMSAGLSMTSDLPKSMAYDLPRYLNRAGEIIPAAILTKAPSVELRPDQKDQDTLPPYDILDQIIQLYLVEAQSYQDTVSRGFDAAVVRWVIRAIDGSLDALMLAYANLKLVRALVIHFGFRRSYPALLTMYGQILAAALIAERVEDMQLQDVFPPLSASVGGGVMSAIPGLHLLVHALLQGMGSAFLTLRTGYLTEEYSLRGAQAFDRRRERQSANRRAAKELLGVFLATAAQLPASMRTLLKAVNLFREPAHQT